MTFPTPDTRPAPRWKSVVIASASAGAGFTLVLAVIVGGVLWYGSRTRPPKPWDAQAVRARYSHASSASLPDYLCDGLVSKSAINACKQEAALGEVLLTYELENATDYDYQISDQSSIQIMERYKTVLEPTLLRVGPDRGAISWRLETPIFVPAHRTVTVHIKGPHQCPRCDEERLKSFVKDEIPELVLFDPNTRYEIELPKP